MTYQAIDPDYYLGRKIEPIDVIESLSDGFEHHRACIIKYAMRLGHKDTSASDAMKIANYAYRIATEGKAWLPKELDVTRRDPLPPVRTPYPPLRQSTSYPNAKGLPESASGHPTRQEYANAHGVPGNALRQAMAAAGHGDQL